MKKLLLTTVLVAIAFLSVGARHRATNPPPIQIEVRRSLVLTDINDFPNFTFERVLTTLIDRSGATDTTPLGMFRQWFDTQNAKPGLAIADAPHCDDFMVNGVATFNGFPRRCPTPEGVLATTDPFPTREYYPIGITNRFDLTPLDGSNCGQYRIVFASLTRKWPQAKLHFIFEPVMPNPHPELGVEGCRPVAQFWADLPPMENRAERAARLDRFFFQGIDGFPPALRPEHFVAGAGRIRTQQLAPGENRAPRFYQFNLEKRGSRLLVVPGLLDNTPYGTLYNSAIELPLSGGFRQEFLSQIATLAIRDVNGFHNNISAKYLMHESNPEDQPKAFSAQAAFNQGMATNGGVGFRVAISAELQRLGSSLSIDEVLVRADMQNCNGCHNGNVYVGDGITFPNGTGSVGQIGELQQVGEDGVTRFWTSGGLINVFGPQRAKILSDFLSGKPLPVHSNGGTLGGGRTSD